MDRKTRVGRVVLSVAEYSIAEVFYDDAHGDEHLLGFSVFGEGVEGQLIHRTVREALEVLEIARLPPT